MLGLHHHADVVELVVQVNGKVRGRLNVPPAITKEEERYLVEIRRVLRPGASVCIEEVFLTRPHGADVWAEYFYTKPATVLDYVRAARSAGFELVDEVDVDVPVYSLAVPILGDWSAIYLVAEDGEIYELEGGDPLLRGKILQLLLTSPGVQVFDAPLAVELARSSNDQLDEAIRNYAAYCRAPDAWLLGRFVCPADRIDELGIGPSAGMLADVETVLDTVLR